MPRLHDALHRLRLRASLDDAAIMRRSTRHVLEGLEAVIGERFRGAAPARNPYTPKSKRGIFWQRGAEHARAKIDEMMRIVS